jgi:hypothetical protein
MNKDLRLDNVKIEFGKTDMASGLINSKLAEIVDCVKTDYEKRHPLKNKAVSDQEKAKEEAYYANVRKTNGRKEVC